MKTKLTLTALASLACITGSVFSQTSITTLNTAFTENFDTYTGTAAPTNFTFSDTDFTPGGIYDIAGAYFSSNSNYALVDSDVSSTDRAFGQKGPTSGSDFLNWTFQNNTGSAISQFSISWDFEQYSEATRATELDFAYNSNGGGFIQTGIVGTTESFASTGSPYANLAAVASQSRAITITLASALDNGEEIVLGWSFVNGAGTGSNAHIGIDNISVTAVPEPSAYAMLAGLSALASVMYRRRSVK